MAANLRLGSPVFRHALRTALTAGIAFALARIVPWTPHPQWVVLTIVAVMQGSLAQFFGVRYSVTAGAAAVMAVLQAHLAAPSVDFGAFERFADTVAGALMGWGATCLLPTWQRKALPAVLRQAMTALRAYAAEATTLRDDVAGLPRFSRQRAYDAIRALAAIRSRSLAEPEDVRVPVPQLTAWLAAAYGEMAHLSNIRLTLTLRARECDRPALAAAMAEVGRAIDTALYPAAIAPTYPFALAPGSEAAISAIPHLGSRTHRALADATRLASQSALIETLVRAPAGLYAAKTVEGEGSAKIRR
ncbi:MAG TPA: hypothetical protein VGM74_11470 [Burkholderiaceae bacterium]